VVVPWQFSGFSLAILDLAVGQVQLGPACRDKEGVDSLVSTIISQMWKHFEPVDTLRSWASTERFFQLVTQVRRWGTLFQGAYRQLEKDANDICTSNLNTVIAPSIQDVHPGFLSRYSRKAMSRYFVERDSKWFVRPWSTAEEEE